VLGGPFRYGMNGGNQNPNWGNDKQALLGAAAGCNGQRIKLPEWLFDQWGYDIETKNGDFQSYAANGLTSLIAFVNGPIAAHSTAPAGKQQWELDYYVPKNLYQPVTLADGSINPENYWATYIYKTVQASKDSVKIWEVWNEPDWVADYTVTQTWDTTAPTAADLPRFNGSVFDYVRLLRVSREAALAADPDAKIATGGLGYPAFLGAILRYTDNPDGGKVTSDYPKKGGDYFDVLSFHYYPLYTPGNSDAAVAGFLKQRADMAKELSDAGITGKAFTATETGAPHQVFDMQPSGPEYARSYLLKVMTLAQASGMIGVDWFALSDGSSATDPYSFMGLYQNLALDNTTDDAVMTGNGTAYATLGKLLNGARFDADGTTALALPAAIGGAAFALPSGHQALVLWATASEGETASASYDLATTSKYTSYAWDYTKTQSTQALAPSAGKLTLALTSSPQIFLEQ
jgi:hypothetical protein